jgi:hypothetical protein
MNTHRRPNPARSATTIHLTAHSHASKQPEHGGLHLFFFRNFGIACNRARQAEEPASSLHVPPGALERQRPQSPA